MTAEFGLPFQEKPYGSKQLEKHLPTMVWVRGLLKVSCLDWLEPLSRSHGSTQLEIFKSCLLRLPTAALGYDKISIIGAKHAKF